jgi:hypothetical protein
MAIVEIKEWSNHGPIVSRQVRNKALTTKEIDSKK